MRSLALSLLLASSDAQTGGCGKTAPKSGKFSFTDQRTNRDYWVHVPAGYDSSKETPVVVLFHGWGYSGAEWTRGSGWGAVSAAPTADKNGFILVAPTGITDSALKGNCDNGAGYCSWNGGGASQSPGPDGPTCNTKKQKDDLCYRDTCSDGCHDICSWTTCNDDTTFVHDLLDRIENEFCVDTKRVYAGGESNGGMMTWQMGTDSRAARFAALVATIGLPHRGYSFRPASLPMPIMGIWGSTDRTIPPGGTNSMGYTEGGGWYWTTARQITSDWADAHGCSTSGNPLKYLTSFDGTKGLACTSFSSGCNYGVDAVNSTKDGTAYWSAPVVDCRFTGGHTVEAFVPDLMWEFMSKHTKK